MTNYASSTVPEWAAHTWVIWPAFGVLVAASTGLLLWGRRLDDAAGPPVRLTSVGRLAGASHGSLRRPHVEKVRGREAELAVLMRMLRRPRGGRFAVVCGAGGLGKTTVAAQLAAEAEEAGWAVFWLRWRDTEQLAQQLTQMAVACGMPESALESARAGQESLPDVIWQHLAGARQWLVVLDNVDDPRAVGPAGERIADYRGWIRPYGGGLLLVTSRDTSAQTWGACAELLHLEPLEVSAAGQVLLDAAPRAGTQVQAQELAVRLGRLPLALQAVGVYLATPTSRYQTFTHYLQAMDAELSTLVGAKHPDASDPETARKVVRHTWELSLNQLAAEENALARPVLRMLSLMAQAPVPLSLITPGLLAAATGEQVTVVGVEAALAGLHRYGLLGLPESLRPSGAEEGCEGTAQVTLHPLVREINALALTEETAETAVLDRWHQSLNAQLIAAVDEVSRAGRPGWPTALLLAPHLLLLRNPETSQTLDTLADVLRAAGAHVPERALRQQVLDVRTRIFGPDHPDTLISRNDLAIALDGLGEYAEAARLHRQTLDDSTRILGPDHPHTLISRNNLASALERLGEYAEAARLHRQTLDDSTRILGPDHPHTLISRNMVATLAAAQAARRRRGRWLHRRAIR
ncbi:tetratricopeptide repeat protein [Streptomyces sp. ISL-11]|nr:tetratricopeptide repeat protein [Streptomyces sp. ISL-11]